MIPQLRTAIYTYLTSGGNPFITLLGAGNLKHKHPRNNKDFPFCVFEETSRERFIDSGSKYIQGTLTFKIYDGSNDGVKESSISASNLEATVEALDTMLDLKDKSITISGYQFVNLKTKSITNAPTTTNAVHGAICKYEFILLKAR